MTPLEARQAYTALLRQLDQCETNIATLQTMIRRKVKDTKVKKGG